MVTSLDELAGVLAVCVLRNPGITCFGSLCLWVVFIVTDALQCARLTLLLLAAGVTGVLGRARLVPAGPERLYAAGCLS